MANVMDSMTAWMQEHIAPLAGKLAANKVLSAISQGMMRSMPLTVGVALISIIINLPIPGISEWMAASGLVAVGNEVIGATMSLMAVYIVWLIAYRYAEDDGMNPVTAGVLAMASFLILVPSTVDMGDGTTITAFKQNYLGSNGIFVALILSVAVAALYGFLTRRNIKLTLPDSVPPMVSDSLSPVFTSMIIFGLMFLIKWAFTFTSFGNVFDFVSSLIGAPLTNIGSSVWAYMIVLTVANICWFFGIHPNAVLSVYFPVIMAINMENMEAFLAGSPLPHLTFALIGSCMYFGGQGNTIGLCIDMLFAKSEKFKAIRPLAFIPNLFNINEPVIFGVPVMLNPIFFIPMALASIVPGIIGLALCSILPISFNPTVQLPWVTPAPITAFFQGGPLFMLIILACIASSALLYLPFFKIADNQAYEEEQAYAAEHNA